MHSGGTDGGLGLGGLMDSIAELEYTACNFFPSTSDVKSLFFPLITPGSDHRDSGVKW